MTAAANSGLRSIDQRRIVKGDVIVTRNVVDTMNKTVNTLSHATSKLANSAAATDIHKLVQRLAGIFLDPLRSCPKYEE